MLRGLNRRRKGFTIIELLIVVIVIGILAAAGIGKYQSFAEKARSRTCMSNQTQIANAFSVYFTQYRGVPEDTSGSTRVMPHNGNTWNLSGTYPWGGGVDPHIRNIIRDTKGFFCPGSLAVYYGGNIGDSRIPAETSNWDGPRRYGYIHTYSGPNVAITWPASAWGGTQYFPDAHDMVFCSEWGIPNDRGPDQSLSSRHSARW